MPASFAASGTPGISQNLASPTITSNFCRTISSHRTLIPMCGLRMQAQCSVSTRPTSEAMAGGQFCATQPTGAWSLAPAALTAWPTSSAAADSSPQLKVLSSNSRAQLWGSREKT